MLQCRRGERLLSRPLLVVGAEEGREQRVGQRLGQLLVSERDVQLDGPADGATYDLDHRAQVDGRRPRWTGCQKRDGTSARIPFRALK